MNSQKYYSKYSGKDIDKAVEYALTMKNEYGVNIVGSSVDNKADFNTITEDGTYISYYYTNSYDDTQTPTKIELIVFHLDDNTVCQKYEYKGNLILRYFSVSENVWSDWAFAKNVLSVDENEEVNVSKPTLILRHVNSTK